MLNLACRYLYKKQNNIELRLLSMNFTNNACHIPVNIIINTQKLLYELLNNSKFKFS